MLQLNPDSEEEKSKNQKEANKLLRSYEYKRAGLELITFSTDEMVREYNDFMTLVFSEPSLDDLIKGFSRLLLYMRKDLYEKQTQLRSRDMIVFMVKDLNEYWPEGGELIEVPIQEKIQTKQTV